MKKLLLATAWVLTALGATAQTYTVIPSSTVYSASGGQVTFTVNLGYPTETSAVAFAARPPASTWSFVSTAGTNLPSVKPNPGDTIDVASPDSAFNFSYIDVPAGSASFTFTLQYPSGLTGNQTLTFSGSYRLNGVLTSVTVGSVVLGNPIITAQPANQAVAAGSAASFSITAGGTAPLSYQWYFTPTGSSTPQTLNDAAGKLGGTHTATLTVSNVQAADVGDYVCTVTNSNGTATSNAAQLTIVADTGLEGDVNGDGTVDAADWVKLGRYVVGLDPMPAAGSTFTKADCAPRTTKGDAGIDAADWTQLGRYVVGLDPTQSAGGPSGPAATPAR